MLNPQFHFSKYGIPIGGFFSQKRILCVPYYEKHSGCLSSAYFSWQREKINTCHENIGTFLCVSALCLWHQRVIFLLFARSQNSWGICLCRGDVVTVSAVLTLAAPYRVSCWNDQLPVWVLAICIGLVITCFAIAYACFNREISYVQ